MNARATAAGSDRIRAKSQALQVARAAVVGALCGRPWPLDSTATRDRSARGCGAPRANTQWWRRRSRAPPAHWKMHLGDPTFKERRAQLADAEPATAARACLGNRTSSVGNTGMQAAATGGDYEGAPMSSTRCCQKHSPHSRTHKCRLHWPLYTMHREVHDA